MTRLGDSIGIIVMTYTVMHSFLRLVLDLNGRDERRMTKGGMGDLITVKMKILIVFRGNVVHSNVIYLMDIVVIVYIEFIAIALYCDF